MKTVEVKFEHTPGPWIFGKAPIHPQFTIGPLVKLSDDSSDIAEICTCRFGLFDEEQVRANARLIAAAPELLQALEEIANRGPVPGYESASALRLRLAGTQTIARAAIAKATPQTVREAL